MDMNNVNIEEIVKQVLSGMTGNAPAAASAPAASTGIPKTARVAVLTEKEHFDIKEYPIPPIGDDDILVKRISLKFVCICTTHTASFNFNQDIVISNRRNRIFFQFEMFLFS